MAFLVALLLISVDRPVAHQSAPMELARVQVSGAKRFTLDAVTKLSGLTVGTAVTVKDLDAAAQRLANTGFFEAVKYRYATAAGRVTVTYEIEEAAWTIPVIFDNFVWFTDPEIAVAMQHDVPTFDGTLPASQELPDRVLSSLQTLLKARGIPGRPTFVPETNLVTKKMQYIFAVTDPAPKLCDLRITGAAVIQEAELRAAIVSLVGTDYSRFSLVQMAGGTLTDMYRRGGYWRARFAAPATAPAAAAGCTGVAATLAVDEGPEYAWDRAEWTGNTIVSPADLDKLLGMKAGERAAAARIDGGLRAVQKVYGRNGYLQWRSRFSPRLDDASRRAVFEIQLEEGPQFRMGSLEIVGLPQEESQTLMKKWRLQPGDVFDDGYPANFQVQELGPLRRRRPSSKAPEIQIRLDALRGAVDVKIAFE